MISLVTFDLHETLCHAVPSRAERCAVVCRSLGFRCSAGDFVRPNLLAEDLYARENGRWPVHQRPEAEQRRLFEHLYALILREAGLPDDAATVQRVRAGLSKVPSSPQLFADVVPALGELRRRGLVLGVVSNTRTGATPLCSQLGLSDLLDFVVSSCEVGCEKPDRRVFETALGRAGVPASQALHVGDQPGADALGAVRAGMHALLLDRGGLLEHDTEYERIASLAEIPGWLDR